jgi:hypothetical protein
MVREWNVVNSGNTGYVFTPTIDPTLERGEDTRLWVRHGDTLVFNVNAVAHPFYLKTSVTSGTGNQLPGVFNNGTYNGQVVYNTSGSSVDTTIYYVSSNNTALSGEIVILANERKTQIIGGRLIHTGSVIIDGGLIVSGATYLTGAIYLNGAPFSGGGGGWFVPIDAMVTHRLNKSFLFAVGASKQVVQSYPIYDWSFYGKLSFNF